MEPTRNAVNSRERFLQTVNHRQPDRMVVDFGSTSVTGIHVKSVENLREYYGLPWKPVRVTDPLQMLGEVDDDLATILGGDVTGAKGIKSSFGFYNHEPFREFTTPWGQTVLVPEEFNTREDKNGDILIYPEGDLLARPSGRMAKAAFFFDAINRQPPMVEEELTPDDNLEEYGLISEADLEYWKETTRKARATGKAVVASPGGTALGDIAHIPGIKLKNPRGIRDITEWYMSILIRPDLVKSIFERQTDIALENLKWLYAAIGDNIDVIYICGTDFGTQDSTFCAPEQFDDLWLPQYRRINDWIHTHTTWKTFKHSCGAVESFIPFFIEAGFDILNPVQVNASGMDPQYLKKTYGNDIVFWGGGIDTQKTLPFSTPKRIREEVLRLCDIFSRDGGYVFNTVHNIQANVPVGNIVALIDAVKEFNGT
jgi:hypothetical protein